MTYTITEQDRDNAVAKYGYHEDVTGAYNIVKALGVNPSNSDDTEFGTDWVYCGQHRRPHATGWCTVHNMDKVPLFTPEGEFDEANRLARAECEKLGLRVL